MQRNTIWCWAAAGALVTSGVTAAVGHIFYQSRPATLEAQKDSFIRHWSQEFRAAHSLAEVQQLPVYTRRFPNGEWIAAVCEHACCSGGGFNVTVIYGSTGQLYANRSRRFCGMEALHAEMNGLSARSMAEFHTGLEEQLQIQLRPTAP